MPAVYFTRTEESRQNTIPFPHSSARVKYTDGMAFHSFSLILFIFFNFFNRLFLLPIFYSVIYHGKYRHFICLFYLYLYILFICLFIVLYYNLLLLFPRDYGQAMPNYCYSPKLHMRTLRGARNSKCVNLRC